MAEGYATVRALVLPGQIYGVDLPICRAVYHILYEQADPKSEPEQLFGRAIKREFYLA